MTDTTLSILRLGGPQPFERTQIATISVKKRGHRLRNALIGVGVGIAVGVGIGLAAGGCKIACKDNQTVLGYAIGGGAFWGAVVGVAWPTGGWRKVYVR